MKDSLKTELEEVKNRIHGSDVILGATLLSVVNNINSSRTIMFTNHRSQTVCLCEPDTPKVFMGYEKRIGELSSAKLQVESNFTVAYKAIKYPMSEENKDIEIYSMFLYDKEKDEYSYLEKKRFENLTEKFGFEYNTDILDSLQVGDEIKKGDILYKSTSYDEYQNYKYGKNVKFAYLVENETIEDGITSSETLSKTMLSKEVDDTTINLNDNDILCNIYGDSETYKGFPDIGEVSTGILCAKRRIFNDRALFDLMDRNLRDVNFYSDEINYSKGRIYDINIFCNRKPIEDIPENPFNSQLLYYLRKQNEYYQSIYDICVKIRESGSKYTRDISYIYNKAKHILDPDTLWRNESNVFGNTIIEFKFEKSSGLSLGSKVTGRYGNKGVIVKIRPDDEMPYLDNGERIDLIFNTNGVINRTNAFQLYEQEITFMSNRVRERMDTLSTDKEKFDLLLEFIRVINKKEAAQLKVFYGELTKANKTKFIKNVIKDGIFINVPPFYHDEPLFETMRNVYKTFPWIKPYDVYINKFGRKIKLIHQLPIGEMYIMKLKQTSEKGNSSRSTGSVNARGLPGKSNKAKENKEFNSTTPIRFGEQEVHNVAIAMEMEVIKDFFMMYRSSPEARKKLCREIMKDGGLVEDIELDDTFDDRNVDILNAYLKTIGLKLDFSNEEDTINMLFNNIETYSKKICGLDVEGTEEELKAYEELYNELLDKTAIPRDFLRSRLSEAIEEFQNKK